MTRWPPTHSMATVPTTPMTLKMCGMTRTIVRPTLSTGPGRLSLGSSAPRARRAPKSSAFTSSATRPYTKNVMKNATPMRTATRMMPVSLDRPAMDTSMISALRIRSVRVAEETMDFSSSSAEAAPPSSCSSWWPGSQPSFSRTFSPPSKHRYAPPTTSRNGRT